MVVLIKGRHALVLQVKGAYASERPRSGAVRHRSVSASPPPRRAGVAIAAQWLRFATVGAANTLVSWCLYAVLEHLGIDYLLASSLAFAVGALNSYAMNRRWTFHSRSRRAPEALRFGVVQCVGLALDVSLLYILVQDVSIHHLIAQALVFPVASTVTFALSRRWAFAASGSTGSDRRAS